MHYVNQESVEKSIPGYRNNSDRSTGLLRVPADNSLIEVASYNLGNEEPLKSLAQRDDLPD